ncbi:MAG: LytTR family transcriptional regulator [Bacteroidetes bacterium]|nr:LytTR family transcriptional regulator [Bacteroidota bacterium]
MLNNKKIFLPSLANNYTSYFLHDIIYVKAERCYSELKSINAKETIKISLPLKQIEEVSNNSNFFRCNRSYIINLNYVTEFSIKKNIIQLNNKFEIPLSETCKKQFINKLKNISKIVFINGGGGNLMTINALHLALFNKKVSYTYKAVRL